MPTIQLVFVHGWSVTHLNTYGNLPSRLQQEGKKNGIDIKIEEIFLGRYISFHDEVRLPDVSRAFKTAVAEQLNGITEFVCITHSTGGPVIRDWWNRYCKGQTLQTRMTHLIMLAPANFGSALAQLGKGTLSRMRSWFNGVEPGQGILDWLELGSSEAWELNKNWILGNAVPDFATGYYPFVLTGQSIDRKLYDSLNSYTGETGSDGVVRVSAANLNASYIKLAQPRPANGTSTKGPALEIAQYATAPLIPIQVLAGKSHTGNAKGIMQSVGDDDAESMNTVTAIFDCIIVNNTGAYKAIFQKFSTQTAAVQQEEQVETVVSKILLTERHFIHDRYTMIIFRVTDTEGYAVNDFDLLLTAGDKDDPNHLPEGFFIDRQQNKKNRNTVTYYLNYDILNGSVAIKTAKDKPLREVVKGIAKLGIILRPRPDAGFVKYVECHYEASAELFSKALQPNSTTLIDIVLQRVVDKEIFRLEHNSGMGSFKTTKPSGDLAE
jgi:hypothetical protein